MTELTEELQQQIIGEWIELKEKIENEFPPYFKPQSGLILVDPIPHNQRPGYHKKIKLYRENIKEWMQENGYKTIKGGCYFYITFRIWREIGKSFPDVDNLLKAFFDTIKKGILLEDDGQIIGVKSNLVKSYGAGNEQESVSFNLIPTYDLEIISVTEINKKDKSLGKLNELRKKYWEQVEKKPDDLKDWNHPMQMVETNLGTFFDNRKGFLWGIESYGKESLHKPESGFDWKSKEPEIGETTKVDGVMIYERSGCWWINKWAE